MYFLWRGGTEVQIDYIRPYFGVDPGRWRGLWWLISARAFHHSVYIDLDWTKLLQEILNFGILVWDNTYGVGLILGIWGWRRLWTTHPVWNHVLSVYALANLSVYFVYHVVDKEVMGIPLYALISVWMASGMKGLVRQVVPQLPRLRSNHVNVLANLLLLLVVGIGAALNVPAVTLSHNRRVYDFSAQLLEDVKPSTVIVNHWVTASVLDYLRIVEGKRPDVASFNLEFYYLGLQTKYGSLDVPAAEQSWFSWLGERLEQGPLCFVEPLPAIPDHLQWTRQGMCWELAAGGPSR
jgi:hypothetical protein